MYIVQYVLAFTVFKPTLQSVKYIEDASV